MSPFSRKKVYGDETAQKIWISVGKISLGANFAHPIIVFLIFIHEMPFLAIIILSSLSIMTYVEINSFASILNAKNCLTLFEGKRDFHNLRLLWRLVRQTMPVNYHRQDKQGRQVYDQHDTRLHRHSPGVKAGNAR
jgi:hypothetical protein